MRKRFLTVILGLAMLMVISTVGYAKTVELTYSIFFPATHGHTLLATEWAKEIEKRTNGAVKINMFPGATLTPPDQCYDGVVKGISDIGMSVLSYTKGRFPLSEVIDLPLGYTKGIQVTRLCNAYYDKFKPKEFDDVKIMYLHGHGPGIFHTKKPVEKMEDLKGMKIRCSGTSAKVVAALGATPVAMPQNECYDALQKGVADGVVSPIETLKGWKFAEVIKSTTQNFGSAYTLGFFVAMNKKKWDSLPKDVQQTIEQVNKEWIDKTGNGWDEFDKIGTEFTLSKGNKVIPLSKEEDAKWAKTVSPVLDEYVAAMKAKGLPGDEALSFCREWLKNNP
ncbi:TRAP transporter substrate-binding protein [Desulfomonile tiedjei]|uniref:TRAP-type C4-dicarboxylate transport system, periplasmic component n=1 Tax=Desulfomonile tiedjei (strain ATCC 49306 / DSM 6799 / DCB-1) TaxID=706587 RepID=I4C0G7_DESTA|nr:TRAP transporter substrate-binding protein [Desulfomonile tiedjei]AFM23058.1 TRAP-type C4-dicarboxylate transport system, periplasmic component [Desulfomonile tiedjei DSM 6799]